jgi:hypothetical protein
LDLLSQSPKSVEGLAKITLMSVEAIELLKTKGVHAFRLEQSVQDWNEFIQQED